MDKHVIICFREPVQGIDPYDGAEIVADRHRLEASHLHIDAFSVSFANSDGELLAKWSTDKVLNIEWPKDHQLIEFGDFFASFRNDLLPPEEPIEVRENMSRPRRQAWSDEETERVIEEFEAGATVKKIAARSERSQNANNLRLVRYGFGENHDARSGLEETLVELFEAGMDVAEIAEQLDRTENMVNLRLLRMGYFIRPPRTRKEKVLVELFEAGMDVAEIAEQLDRTPFMIEMELRRLGRSEEAP